MYVCICILNNIVVLVAVVVIMFFVFFNLQISKNIISFLKCLYSVYINPYRNRKIFLSSFIKYMMCNVHHVQKCVWL